MAQATLSSQPATTAEISHFYDEMSQDLLRDYVVGNPRVSAAIETVEARIRPETKRVLDIGCGIGISSHRFRQGRDWLTVDGVDISPSNVSIATRLFGRPGLKFAVSDMSQVPQGSPYDLVAMLDVYEHIPRGSWPSFHQVLGEALAPTGTLVLSTPTYLHQQYLAEHDPAGLQIVDETVTLDDFINLARDLEATITKFEMVSIWHSHDYTHVVMSRAPSYVDIRPPKTLLSRLERRLLRRDAGQRLLRRLHARRRLSVRQA